MMKFNKAVQWGVIACTIFLLSCTSDSETGGPKTEYNREAMLANYGENIILPAYQVFRTETTELTEAVNQFTANPTTQTLASAQATFKKAYLTWQDLSVFHFGPAEEQLLRSNLNVYPTDTTQIKNNITSGTYNFGLSANAPAKGFPAVDYLLFSRSANNLLNLYTTAPDAANRKKYLKDVVMLINQHAQATYTAWAPTGSNYIKTFKEAAGTAVGSSVGNLVNQLNQDIDITKRFKVYIPVGGLTSDIPIPGKTEAYFSGMSLELLERNVRAQKRVFTGQTSQGTDGPGLDDYLNHVNAKYNDKPLAQVIASQYDAVLAAIATVPKPLSTAVNTNQQSVKNVYNEFQKLIVLTKTDMPQALGVTISYQDNDGD
jgi:uncharacterized protein